MQEEPILIDQLEDKIIDHPDASVKREVDTNLDAAFQKKLNERAEQFASKTNGDPQDLFGVQFLATKTKLQYDHSDFGSLKDNLNEWFAFHDFELIGLHQLPYTANRDIDECVERLSSYHNILKVEPSTVDSLLYYTFGTFQNKSENDQIDAIKLNSRDLAPRACGPIIVLVQNFMESRIEADSAEDSDDEDVLEKDAVTYFKLLTILYFMVNVMLHSQNEHVYEDVRDILNDYDLISSCVRFIEHWKWCANSSYRVRHLILLVWKLVLVEFGDSKRQKKVDDFLVHTHNIRNKKGKDIPEYKLTCSPLEYFTFREDLLDKYPLFTEKPSPFHVEDMKQALNDIDTDTESVSSASSVDSSYQYFMAMNNQSNSLSNLLETPRPNKSHTMLSQLPAQTIHIATPVPSPPTTPSDFMSGGEKIRKLYHVNQGMPFIYPNAGDEAHVPYAIKEADEILKASVYESYSIKRLWNERQKFMIQERGFKSEYLEAQLDEFEYTDELYDLHPESTREIKSLLRVESFYRKNLSRLNSLVQVLVEVIKSNKYDYNLNFALLELNPETSYLAKMINKSKDKTISETSEKVEHIIMQQLEVQKIKETTLKASSGLMILLLKWFKINHVIKYYYLSSVLFDLQFFAVFIDFLSRSFNNHNLQKTQDKSKEQFNFGSANVSPEDSLTEYETVTSQNKLMNPEIKLPKFEFFNNCTGKVEPTSHNLINNTPIMNLPSVLDEDNVNNIMIKDYNKNYCFILTNLLNVCNKILIKNITQRTFILNETKPSEFFKIILSNYDNVWLRTPTLKILKKLIPYQGRKWKSVNMDLISMIYLHLKLSLKDNWLSGRDLENDFNNSFDQEIALRSLLQFYNIRKYPAQMELLGYKISTDDIPVLELNEEVE